MGYFRLPAAEFARLQRLARSEDRPVSDLVRRAVRELLIRSEAA